ncbi:hypothetical protein [Photobacterium nomapromontoriensis]|uniref:hypothetical protein n=1 Tax=Photobacterium nomapromontoriensis TaxID=2910237 RepID=UPI003D12A09E
MTKWQAVMWEKAKSQGVIRYVIIYGMLLWGIPMVLMMGYMNDTFSQGLFTQKALVHTSLWLIIGLLFGGINWLNLKRQANKAKSRP